VVLETTVELAVAEVETVVTAEVAVLLGEADADELLNAVEVEVDTTLEEEETKAPALYTFNLELPPQSSSRLSTQGSRHSAIGAGTAPAAKALPHQHSCPYSRPA
jgi:hypothetical protein